MTEKLPCDICKGRCCKYPAMTKREFKTIRKKYGVPKNTTIVKIEDLPGANGMSPVWDDGTCVYLKDGKCSVYEIRPHVCRIYGTDPEVLPCEYLYPEKANKTVEEMTKSILKKYYKGAKK